MPNRNDLDDLRTALLLAKQKLDIAFEILDRQILNEGENSVEEIEPEGEKAPETKKRFFGPPPICRGSGSRATGRHFPHLTQFDLSLDKRHWKCSICGERYLYALGYS